ncbi:carbohydrate kinase [Tahibacter sp.]|uniref:carbohydrate kinase family protein n=1 Tax=Tahibacter sp. TaxID=2056211 RepID=UPI0028C4FAEB|nr:carbohydrate kinase [Tahibacter sp.]
MKPIACFGEALIDLLAQPEMPPAPRAFLQFAGGAPANVAVAAARLGAETQFIGMLGEDLFGDFLLRSLVDAGVGTQHVVRTAQAKTALAFVALDAVGERSFSFYRPPAADLLFRPQHFSEDAFDAAIWHVCSNSLTETDIAATTLAGMRRARAAGALISLDLNLRPALWPADVDPHPRLWAALAEADIVKLARNELDHLAAPLGGAAAVLERLWRGRARWLVITDGAAPLRWHTRDAQGEIDPFRVTAIDTTAAGDAFVGALLAGLRARAIDAASLGDFLAQRDAMRATLRRAAAAGAVAVTRHGAFAAMPDPADIDALLQGAP